MDALALLCTLYAEGPVTLARLRQKDCATIEQVIAMDAGSLAAILPGTEATAQRLQREARNLIERLGAEDGDAPHVAHAPLAANGPFAANAPRARSSRPPVLDRVLAAWRERDEQDEQHEDREHHELLRDTSPEDHEVNAAGSPGQDFHEPVPEESVETMRVEILQPTVRALSEEGREPAAAAGGRALEPGDVDGLDAGSIRDLARAGVRDLRALARCDALDVARKSGITWSRLARLRALAARSVGPLAEPTPDPRPPPLARAAPLEKVSPSDRPGEAHEALRGFEREPALQHAAHEGAGGPFA
jgi:hypothetical protein